MKISEATVEQLQEKLQAGIEVMKNTAALCDEAKLKVIAVTDALNKAEEELLKVTKAENWIIHWCIEIEEEIKKRQQPNNDVSAEEDIPF